MAFNIGDTLDSLVEKLDGLGRCIAWFIAGAGVTLTITFIF